MVFTLKDQAIPFDCLQGSTYKSTPHSFVTSLKSKQFLTSPKNCLRRSSIDDVRDGFHIHREFLVASMLEGQEGLDWSQNPMLQYYKKQFPVSIAMISKRAEF